VGRVIKTSPWYHGVRRKGTAAPGYLETEGFECASQVRLQLFVLAYNLGNFLRQAVLPRAVRRWTLATLREKLIKIGVKVVCRSRNIVFQMSEAAVP